MKKIITILGDSLSMTRSEYGIFYKDTYPYILVETLGGNYLVLNKSTRANTIVEQTTFQNIYDDVLTTDSEYFVIQLGIVDCAPRIISIAERKVIKYIRPKCLGDFYIRIKSKHRWFLTKNFPKVYVNPRVFVRRYDYLISTILEKTNAKKVILINIADTNKKNKVRSCGLAENIRKYNAFTRDLKKKFDKNVGLIDLYAITKNNPTLILDDGIHVTKSTHKLLAEKIVHIITTADENG